MFCRYLVNKKNSVNYLAKSMTDIRVHHKYNQSLPTKEWSVVVQEKEPLIYSSALKLAF